MLRLRRFYAIIHLKVGNEVKSFKQMQLDVINKNYKEHRGCLFKNTAVFFGNMFLLLMRTVKNQKFMLASVFIKILK